MKRAMIRKTDQCNAAVSKLEENFELIRKRGNKTVINAIVLIILIIIITTLSLLLSLLLS